MVIIDVLVLTKLITYGEIQNIGILLLAFYNIKQAFFLAIKKIIFYFCED